MKAIMDQEESKNLTISKFISSTPSLMILYLESYDLAASQLSYYHCCCFLEKKKKVLPRHLTFDVIFITLNSHGCGFISWYCWSFPLMPVYSYTIQLFLKLPFCNIFYYMKAYILLLLFFHQNSLVIFYFYTSN